MPLPHDFPSFRPLSPPPPFPQSPPSPPANTAQAFQCFYGADIAGDAIASYTGVVTSQGCATLCLTTPSCTLFSFVASSASSTGTCFLRNNPFAGTGGSSGTNPLVAVSCLNIAASGECSPCHHTPAFSVRTHGRSEIVLRWYGQLT